MVESVLGPTNRVIVVGAGLAGLSCAIRLAAAGREVTVVERSSSPGGQVGLLELDGFRFDTGPTTFDAPHQLDAVLAEVGEQRTDWLDLTPLEPATRAHFPDGTWLDIYSDAEQMAAEISRLCGGREAAGYLRMRRWARAMDQFDNDRQAWRAPVTEIARRVACRVTSFLADPRTRRVFGFGSLLDGLTPADLALTTVDRGGRWYPQGGLNAVPRALAAVAEKHGVNIRYHAGLSEVEVRGSSMVAVRTAEGERITADALVLPADQAPWYGLSPHAPTARPAPSCILLHLGSRAAYQEIRHQNLHFGKVWELGFEELIKRGDLMSDPTLLVTNASRTDPTVAPAAQHSYQVLVPVPNLTAAPIDWDGPVARRYAGELVATLEARGYLDLGAGLTLSYVVTPADWERQGMPHGSPFTGTTRHSHVGGLHPHLRNVVFTGSGGSRDTGICTALRRGAQAAARVIGVGT